MKLKLPFRNLKYSIIVFFLFFLACQQEETKIEADVENTAIDKMDWWKEARFGMFIHWGVYSIPAGEYKGEITKRPSEWIMNDLHIPLKEYERLPSFFNPLGFNAYEMVGAAKDAGMKYIVITTKHHDGFCMWDSKYTEYDINDASPYSGDIIKEIAEACDALDVKLGFYHSIMDWHHPDAQAIWEPDYNQWRDSEKKNPNFEKYFKEYLKPQVKELITKYPSVKVLWFDGEWIPAYTSEMGKELNAMINELNPEIIVNNRVDKGRKSKQGFNKEGNFAGDFGTPEQEIPDTGVEGVNWESCMTMNKSWGYKKSDDNWKSGEELTAKLIDIVSKGGNFLLNVGPTADGIIPRPSQAALYWIGNWMKYNSESIYGTNPSQFEKPEWGRFTTKEDKIYGHIFEWPENNTLAVLPDTEEISSVYFLHEGEEKPLKISKKNGNWEVALDSAVAELPLPVLVMKIAGN